MIVANTVHVFFFLQIQIVVNVFIFSEVDSLILVDVVVNIFFDACDLPSQYKMQVWTEGG